MGEEDYLTLEDGWAYILMSCATRAQFIECKVAAWLVPGGIGRSDSSHKTSSYNRHRSALWPLSRPKGIYLHKYPLHLGS